MKIISIANGPVDMALAEFEQKHGLEMVVTERPPEDAKRYGRWYAKLVRADGYGINLCDNPTTGRSMFQGFTSDGNTAAEAVQAYLKRISGQYIVPDMADASQDFWAGQITAHEEQ